jgi:hypothetical protein
MAGFPPKKASKSAPAVLADPIPGPVSTGGGGIPASLKIKAAGTKNAPGVERDVNLS